MNENLKINSINLSKDEENIILSLNNGFIIYSLNPFTEKYKYEDNKQIQNAICLTSSSKVVFTGTPNQKQFSDRSICVFDMLLKRPLTQIDSPEPVIKILMLPKMFAIAIKSEIRLYNFEPSGLFSQLRCHINEYAPCDFIESNGNYIIAMTGKQPGILRITNVESKNSFDLSIIAHNHPITNIKFNQNGTQIATCSTQGTIIRIFNVENGDKIAEFRRGTFSADIFSISFSPLYQLLSLISSNNTLHLFKINSEFQRSLLSWKIPESTYNITCFYGIDSILIISNNGNLYILKFNESIDSIKIETITPLII